MAGTTEGAIKTAAKRRGMTVEDYLSMLATGHKWCTACKAWHRHSLFQKDRTRGDGLAASCNGKAKRAPVQQRLFAEYELRERTKEWYRMYYRGPAGAAIRARVYARKRDLEPIPDWWREEMLEMGCAYCDAPATTLDHVIPVVRGGRSEPGNLVPACNTCNSRKKGDDPNPWIDRMRPVFIEMISARPLAGMGSLERLEGC